MKSYLSSTKVSRARCGFTLVETVIAMGIITIMITAFLAAFGPAVKGVRKSISAKEASRLASTLEYEMSVLRQNEQSSGTAAEPGKYRTAFEKGFNWIKDSNGTSNDDLVLIYQYKGDPSSPRTDGSGTLNPISTNKVSESIPGVDFVLQSVVRRLRDSDAEVRAELVPGIVEGRVFVVRMTQLIYDADGELVESKKPEEILDPHGSNATTTYENYPEAVIAFRARYYVLKSSLYQYVKNVPLRDVGSDGTPRALGKAIFTRNMAIRR